MKLKEFEKRMWDKKNLWGKIKWVYYGAYFTLEHHFRRITKICPHDSSFGAVGGNHICLDCGREIGKG